MKPTIVCLCGSTRFSQAFRDANLQETLAGRIVLTIGCDMRSDAEVFADKSSDELEQIKARLDELHLQKIDMADEVLILNVDGYVGQSTRRELQHAVNSGKRVRWLEPEYAFRVELSDVCSCGGDIHLDGASGIRFCRSCSRAY